MIFKDPHSQDSYPGAVSFYIVPGLDSVTNNIWQKWSCAAYKIKS